MTISKSNLIKIIQSNYTDKETQYNIYKIIKSRCPNSIINNKDRLTIEMSKVDIKTIYEIKKFLDVKEKSKNYENKIEKEINDLKKQMESLKIKNIEENYILSQNLNQNSYDYDKSVKHNWKKYWKSDYKGNTDNICEEHIRNIKYFKFKNKRWNEMLKTKKKFKSSKMYLNRKGETGFENDECVDLGECQFVDENDFEMNIDMNIDMNINEEIKTDIEDLEHIKTDIEDLEEIKTDIEDLEEIKTDIEDLEEIKTDIEDLETDVEELEELENFEKYKNKLKETNKLLFGESDTDFSDDEKI
jgi:hypothetical protein